MFANLVIISIGNLCRKTALSRQLSQMIQIYNPLSSCCSDNPCAVTRTGYAEVVQILVEQLQQQSAGGSGTVHQVLKFVAALKDDLVKMAAEGEQQGKAVGTQWLLKESLRSQFHLYASMAHHNHEAILEVLRAMLASCSPAAVEVAMEMCAGVLVGKEALLPHQAFLEVCPLDLRKAGGDMQLAVSLSLIKVSFQCSIVLHMPSILYICIQNVCCIATVSQALITAMYCVTSFVGLSLKHITVSSAFNCACQTFR